VRDWKGAEKKGISLAPFVTQLNHIRREHPALHGLRNLVFHNTSSDAIIAYSKREGSDLILVVVNLDPTYAQEGFVNWDMGSLSLASEKFSVTDLLDGSTYDWSPNTFIRLDPSRPHGKVAHIAHVKLS
jgi:starch synthase (maltosyl-transferring)